MREEIEHVREGKHGARSAKQAIAIGLSKARRAGIKLPPRRAASHRALSQQAHRSARRRGRADRSRAGRRAARTRRAAA